MSRLTDLLLQDDLNTQERNEFVNLVQRLEQDVADAAGFVQGFVTTISQRTRFMRAMDVYTTGMSLNSLARGVQFFNAAAGGHVGFAGVIDGTHGEYRVGVDDDFENNHTEATFSIRHDPASPTDTNQFDFNILDD